MATAEEKVYSLEEVKGHVREDDCWLVINGFVYDVTAFLDEHPGGFDIIIANTGKDASEDYEEIGHSNAAHELLANYKIGKYKGGPPPTVKRAKSAVKVRQTSAVQTSPIFTLLKVLLPVVVIAAIFLPRFLTS